MKTTEIKIFKQDSSDWFSLLISFFHVAYLTAFSFCTNYIYSDEPITLKGEKHENQ